jgi:hypothetical protein
MCLAGLLAVVLALAGCGNQAPQPARFVPPAPSVAEFDGSLRAHYNLLPTLALGEAVAHEYGVERDAGLALLIVALRQSTADGEEVTAPGEVTAEAVDLAGRRQTVALRRVAAGSYVDHVGIVRISARDTVRVEVAVVAGENRHAFDFQRNF